MEEQLRRLLLRAGGIALALVLVVGVMLLPSCGGKKKQDPAQSGTTATPGTTGTAVQTPITQSPQTTQGYSLPESLYGPEDFVLDGDYLSCTAGNAMLGIDVSSHQGTIDWEAVAKTEVEFVFVRIAYRGYETGLLHTDKRAIENLRGAREAGLLVGAYIYSQAISIQEAQEEAQYALDVLGDFQLDLPLVYDWECVGEQARTYYVKGTALTEYTIAFCEAVKNAGCEPMVYFNSNQAKRMLDMEKLERYAWWIAMYNTDGEMLCKADAWQYSYTGYVDGISTNVDLNLLFTDYGIGQVFAKTE